MIKRGMKAIVSRKKSKNMARVPLPNPKNIFIKITIGAVKISDEAKMRKAGVAIATNAGSLEKIPTICPENISKRMDETAAKKTDTLRATKTDSLNL